MSETTNALKDVDQLPSKPTVLELLLKKFEQLSDAEKNFFTYGPLYLGFNGAFSGLIANSLFRRVLSVTHGRYTSSLPMAVLPFLTTVAAYHGAISEPLLSGELNCQSCAQVRGVLVGAVVGGLYPILLALPMNIGLAARYNTAPMPEKGKLLPFLASATKPVLRKMTFVLGLQAFFAFYLSSRHYGIYLKMLKMPPVDSED
ncbi:transmembrane protein 126A-like [Megalops cyprinoides]|uniref:transmembrane protein 126A-like n=1 Tax=Megalops cyprinoides TaxID=118141 RepID=UPI0018651C84|nr:transmembrane protein 126A-like [Megalops cyprinoides]